jgi:RNA polymerase sigma-70 factor, ECF subfamily
VAVEFTDWYEAEHPKVLGALCALSGNADAARDATDEAFVRALTRWARVQRMQSPAGWTFRVAHNQLRRTLKRGARDRAMSQQAALGAVPVPSTDVELWIVVRSLPERQRTAVVLRYVLDLAEADIAIVMGIKRGTVSATLAQARARLAVLLDADEQPEATENKEEPHAG